MSASTNARGGRQGRCRTLTATGMVVSVLATMAPAPAFADVEINPFVSLRQVVSDGTGRDTRGWLEAGAGFAALLDTNRIDGNISYRYMRRIEEFGSISQKNRHNANANVRAELIDDFLMLNAGGTASQYATDMRGFNAINPDDENGNQTQIFSGYIEPTVQQRLGDFATFQGRYRLGAVSADSPREGLTGPGSIGLDPSDGIGSRLSDSVTQTADLTLASTRATNTFNWSLTAQGTREDVDQLNQKYRGYSAGGEIGYRLSRKFELIASGGYEDIDNTQDSILFDPITGLPDLDEDGRFQVDPAMPRRTAYDFSGIYWNGGFRFTPSRRTSLEFRAGERYGSANFFLDFNHRSRNGMSVRANFQQTLNSFSRLLTQSFNGVPFNVVRVGGLDQLGVPFCVIGIDPESDDGGCLGGFTQSLTPATFKSDRGLLMVSRKLEAFTWSASVYYDKRRYVDAQQLQAPTQSELPTGLFGDDESFGVRGRVAFRLGELQTLGFDALLARNSYALSAQRKDTQITLGSQYTRRLSKHLSGNASFYGTHRITETRSDSSSVTASVGVRYNF
ncbi:hypothetical protein [Sphingosinicella soli]|uniref:TIGR03016 family PEP-CTERM system-associated outer membrane protein n=1 Tax=Sphingosinicella soli TaxID=333708 RepID=A0A7W7F5G4_9SPHN|nr:hypothetical protein [Sphingosinicella soli]MBB4630664.1 hypothetical protein [Sphingosinicella soli]